VIAVNLFVGKPWAQSATAMLAGSAILVVGLFGAADMAGIQVLAPNLSAQTRFALDAGQVVTAVAAAGFLIPAIRRDIAMLIPIDPDSPVHTLALVLATLLLGTQVTSIAFTDVLATDLGQAPLTVTDLLLDEAPFLVLAVAGVGLYIRRNVAATASRLGIVRPQWWHIVIALAAAGLFVGLGQVSDLLSHTLSPDLARRVDATTSHVFGQLDNPIGIAAIALIPGICEEILFRGALQPRLGLVATAVLFTAVHTEYGLSFDTLAVFVLAIGLGLVRKYTSTTASCTCHVTYNLLVGIGLTGAVLNVAYVAEAALIAVAAYAVWADRRRRAEAGR